MVNADMQTAADVQYHQNEIADVIGRELSIVFKVLVITQDHFFVLVNSLSIARVKLNQ